MSPTFSLSLHSSAGWLHEKFMPSSFPKPPIPILQYSLLADELKNDQLEETYSHHHIYQTTCIRAPIHYASYYCNNLVRLLKPMLPLVPLIPPPHTSSKVPLQWSSPPLKCHQISLSTRSFHKTGYFSHLKKKKIPPWTSYPLPSTALSMFQLAQNSKSCCSDCLTSSPPILPWTHPYHAFGPTGPLKQLFSRSSVEWPPYLQIILFYSVVEPDLSLANLLFADSSSSSGALNLCVPHPLASSSVLEALTYLNSLPRSSLMASNTILMSTNSKFLSSGSTSSLNSRFI